MLQRAVAMMLEAVYENGVFGRPRTAFRPRSLGASGIGCAAQIDGERSRAGRSWRSISSSTSTRFDHFGPTARDSASARVHATSDRAPDRQVAQCGCDAGRRTLAQRRWHAAGRGDFCRFWPTSTCTRYSTYGLKMKCARALAVALRLTRCADDAVFVVEREEDACRVLSVLPKRFERYGLALHPDKTRLVPLKRPDRSRNRDVERSRPWPPGASDFSRLHRSTGPKSLAGRCGRDESNGKRPLTSDARRRSRAVVQAASSPAAARCNRSCSQRQTTGHYGYFWPDGQSSAAMWLCCLGVQRRVVGGAAMPPLAACEALLGGDASAASSSIRSHWHWRRFHRFREANPSFEEPDAADSARPDPWGPRRAIGGATRQQERDARFTRRVAHEPWHLPATHPCPATHCVPQVPQLAPSVERSEHVPAQLTVPGGQVHAPLVQTRLLPQIWEQSPQLFLFD